MDTYFQSKYETTDIETLLDAAYEGVISYPWEAYDPATVYEPLRKVTYQGGSYLKISESAAGVVPTNTTYWLVIAAPGEPGPTTIAIGTVTTGAPGTNVAVTNSGTSEHVVLNFTIPRGADGTGSGDMTKAVYDPAEKEQDIFAYADAAGSIAGLTAETTIADTDYFPYNDVSVSGGIAKRKTLWSNIKSVLKTYFDALYTTALLKITGYTKPSSTSALAATDTINAALGKLEKALDAKAALAPSVVSRTASYTLGLTDAGTMQKCSSTSAITVTIPLNSSVAFPTNTEIVLARYNTGAVSLSPTSGVILYSSGSKRSINAQYEAVTLKKMGTDEWLLVGALAT